MSDYEDMIDNILDDNTVEAQKDFDNIISDKIKNALDAKKIELASTLYNPSEEENPDDLEQEEEFEEDLGQEESEEDLED